MARRGTAPHDRGRHPPAAPGTIRPPWISKQGRRRWQSTGCQPNRRRHCPDRKSARLGPASRRSRYPPPRRTRRRGTEFQANLARHRCGIEGIDLDDVAEPVGLGCIVRRTGVEAGVDGLPPVDALPLLQPVATAADCGWIGHKVVVEVLLARLHGAPGRRTAGTVAEGTDHAAPARVISGLQEMASRCRTGHRERRTRGDPPVSRRTADVVPRSSSARAFQLDDAEALRGHRRFEHLTLVCCRPGRREHDLAIGELVVTAQQRQARRKSARCSCWELDMRTHCRT